MHPSGRAQGRTDDAVNSFERTAVWRHVDGTVCHHRLARDSEAPGGLYCVVTHSDVILDSDADVLAGYGRHRAETPTVLTSYPLTLAYVAAWVIGSCLFAGLVLYVVDRFV
jgi:hypothetical protein